MAHLPHSRAVRGAPYPRRNRPIPGQKRRAGRPRPRKLLTRIFAPALNRALRRSVLQGGVSSAGYAALRRKAPWVVWGQWGSPAVSDKPCIYRAKRAKCRNARLWDGRLRSGRKRAATLCILPDSSCEMRLQLCHIRVVDVGLAIFSALLTQVLALFFSGLRGSISRS